VETSLLTNSQDLVFRSVADVHVVIAVNRYARQYAFGGRELFRLEFGCGHNIDLAGKPSRLQSPIRPEVEAFGVVESGANRLHLVNVVTCHNQP
jgi:hypothetical protein